MAEVAKERRWLRTTAFIIGIIALSVGLVYLLHYLEMYLEVSLEGFAPLAYLIVFVATLLSSATIIVPAPGVAIMIAAAAKWDPVLVALVASVGGTLGELTGYYAGHLGTRLIIREYPRGYYQAVGWMNRYGLWAVFFFALFPFLIFDLIGIAAGALRLPLWKFLLVCWGGRLPRSLFECFAGMGLFRLFFPLWLG